MSCSVCNSCLGCAVDCSDAPWNLDCPKTNRLGYLRRLVRWLRSECGYPLPLPFRPDLHWL